MKKKIFSFILLIIIIAISGIKAKAQLGEYYRQVEQYEQNNITYKDNDVIVKDFFNCTKVFIFVNGQCASGILLYKDSDLQTQSGLITLMNGYDTWEHSSTRDGWISTMKLSDDRNYRVFTYIKWNEVYKQYGLTMVLPHLYNLSID